MNYVKWVMWQTHTNQEEGGGKKKIKTKFLLKICTQKFMNEIFNVIDQYENVSYSRKNWNNEGEKSPGPVL